MNPTSSQDSSTASRIRQEWTKMTQALKNKGGAADQDIQDPLGQDGPIAVRLAFFKADGGGEVLVRKGLPPQDRRYTRFRAYGDTIEKTSYLKKENGQTEFHKRTVESGDKVTYLTQPEGDDKDWLTGLE